MIDNKSDSETSVIEIFMAILRNQFGIKVSQRYLLQYYLFIKDYSQENKILSMEDKLSFEELPVQLHFIIMKSPSQLKNTEKRRQRFKKFTTQYDRRDAPRNLFHETVDICYGSKQRFIDIAQQALNDLNQQSANKLAYQIVNIFERPIPNPINFFKLLKRRRKVSKQQEFKKFLESQLSDICRLKNLTQPIVIEFVPPTLEMKITVNLEHENGNNTTNYRSQRYPLSSYVDEIINQQLQFLCCEQDLSIYFYYKLRIEYIDVFGKGKKLQISQYQTVKAFILSLDLSTTRSSNKMQIIKKFLFASPHIELHQLLCSFEQPLSLTIHLERISFFSKMRDFLSYVIEILRQWMRYKSLQCYFDDDDNANLHEKQRAILKEQSDNLRQLCILQPFKKLSAEQYKQRGISSNLHEKNAKVRNYDRRNYQFLFVFHRGIVNHNQTIEDFLIDQELQFNQQTQLLINRNKHLLTDADLRTEIKTTLKILNSRKLFHSQEKYKVDLSQKIDTLIQGIPLYEQLYFQICPQFVSVAISLQTPTSKQKVIMREEIRVTKYIDQLIETYVGLQMIKNNGLVIREIEYDSIIGSKQSIKAQTLDRRKHLIKKIQSVYNQQTQQMIFTTCEVKELMQSLRLSKYHCRLCDLIVDWQQEISLKVKLDNKDKKDKQQWLSWFENYCYTFKLFFEEIDLY